MRAFSASAAAAAAVDFAICVAAANHKSFWKLHFATFNCPSKKVFGRDRKGLKRLGESLLKVFAALINET